MASFAGPGGPPMPPQMLRNLSSPVTHPSLLSLNSGFSKTGGARSTLRVGNFLTFCGSPGIWGPISTNSVLLAVAEINKRGGILGREIELSFYEAGGSVDEVTQRAAEAIANDEVDVIMGSHISAVRVALRKVTRNRVPYVYTPVYEGGEQ